MKAWAEPVCGRPKVMVLPHPTSAGPFFHGFDRMFGSCNAALISGGLVISVTHFAGSFYNQLVSLTLGA
jgi:hypothetical protein